MVFKPLTFNLNQENFSLWRGGKISWGEGKSFGTRIKIKRTKTVVKGLARSVNRQIQVVKGLARAVKKANTSSERTSTSSEKGKYK